MPSRTMRQLLIAALAVSATSGTLTGQAPPAPSADTIETRSVGKRGVDPRFLLRIVPAAAMGAGGGFLGGLIGMGANNDGWGGLVIGVLAGGTLGSAIGAAAPKGRGVCTPNARFWRALAGATLGLGTGIAIVRNAPSHPAWLATIPIGSVMLLMEC